LAAGGTGANVGLVFPMGEKAIRFRKLFGKRRLMDLRRSTRVSADCGFALDERHHFGAWNGWFDRREPRGDGNTAGFLIRELSCRNERLDDDDDPFRIKFLLQQVGDL